MFCIHRRKQMCERRAASVESFVERFLALDKFTRARGEARLARIEGVDECLCALHGFTRYVAELADMSGDFVQRRAEFAQTLREIALDADKIAAGDIQHRAKRFIRRIQAIEQRGQFRTNPLVHFRQRVHRRPCARFKRAGDSRLRAFKRLNELLTLLGELADNGVAAAFDRLGDKFADGGEVVRQCAATTIQCRLHFRDAGVEVCLYFADFFECFDEFRATVADRCVDQRKPLVDIFGEMSRIVADARCEIVGLRL